MIATPPEVIGIVRAVLPHALLAAACSWESMVTSDPANGTLPVVNCWIPAVEPVPL